MFSMWLRTGHWRGLQTHSARDIGSTCIYCIHSDINEGIAAAPRMKGKPSRDFRPATVLRECGQYRQKGTQGPRLASLTVNLQSASSTWDAAHRDPQSHVIDTALSRSPQFAD